MSEHEEGQQKTVLCVFKDRKRPVTFLGDQDAKKERQNLLEAVKASFSDLLEGSSGAQSAPQCFLQYQSSEWGMIEVTGRIQDRNTVHLCLSSGDGNVSESLPYRIYL